MLSNLIASSTVFLISTISICADQIETENAEFRCNFIKELKAHPKKYNSKGKFFNRSLVTLSCGDCDHIKKVPGAGQLFVDKSSKTTYQLMHNGVKVVKDCYFGKSDNWMRNIIHGARGHHEPQEEKAFHEVLQYAKPTDVMLELGSYWAYYSLWFKKDHPNRRTILVEPSKPNLQTSRKNYQLNKQEGEYVWGFAGKSDTTCDSFEGIPYIDIENLLKQKKIKKLFMLHADIQGAELPLLKSITNLLQSEFIQFCFISTHSKSTHVECLSVLKKSGMIIVAEHTPAESYSCDGLIVAKSPSSPGPKHIKFSRRKI